MLNARWCKAIAPISIGCAGAFNRAVRKFVHTSIDPRVGNVAIPMSIFFTLEKPSAEPDFCLWQAGLVPELAG